MGQAFFQRPGVAGIAGTGHSRCRRLARQLAHPGREVIPHRLLHLGSAPGSVVGKELGEVRPGLVEEARDEGTEVSIRLDLGRVAAEFLTLDQPTLLAKIHDLLEEPLKNPDAEPLPDAGQTRVVREVLVEGIAEGVSDGPDGDSPSR